MVSTRTVSFRSQLKGSISDFLSREQMVCPHTEEGLLQLAVALAYYTEEGNPLYPEIVLCDDLQMTLSLLQGSDTIRIGQGPRDAGTIHLALKRCATLATTGWLIYVQRHPEQFEYGVFRSPSSPTAPDARSVVYSLIHDKVEVSIILASQLAENAVELVGVRSGALRIFLSATRDDSPTPSDALTELVDACTENVELDIKEQTGSYLHTSLGGALRRCHGTLVGVVRSKDDAQCITPDGVIFDKQKSISTLIRNHELLRSAETLARLNAYSQLIHGMINTDGMILVSSGAEFLGYNLFVQKQNNSNETSVGDVSGGARRRAFGVLRSMVDSAILRACFIRSSDGLTEFYGRS